MRYAFIEDHRATWPIAIQCRVLVVSRSGYYEWRRRPVFSTGICHSAIFAHHLAAKGRDGTEVVLSRIEGGVTDYVSHDLTLHYGAIAAKEPRGEETHAACRKLGRRLAEWTAVFCHSRREEHPSLKMSERMMPEA